MDKLMSLLTSEYSLTFWIPVVFLILGVITLIAPPKYSKGVGFATKRAVKSEKVWNYVHKLLGWVCIALTVVLALCTWLTLSLIGGTAGYLIQIAIDVAAIALLVPIINWLTDRKFDWNR